MDPDALREIAVDAFKVWIVLAVLGLPAQLLLRFASRTPQKHRRSIALLAAAAVLLVAALITSLAFSSYDGTLSHSVVLFATLAIFSIPAQCLFFLGTFRLTRILPRVTALAGGAVLLLLGVVAFGLRSLAYGLQHSLGGWP